MIKEKLIERFGKHINHMSCVYLNNGESHLRELIQKCGKINTAIEIGTYQGVSACIISEYAKNVITVDIEEQSLTKDIIQYLGIDNIKSFIFDDINERDSLIKECFDNDKIDFVFIDGEHFHGELKHDFSVTKKCKNILVHDYSVGFPEVYDFCNALTGYKKTVGGDFILLQKEVKRGRKSRDNTLG